MCCSHKGVRCSDHLTSDAQCLQCCHKGDGAIAKQRKVFHPEVFRQLLFQLFMERTAISQAFAAPDLLQVRQKLFERRKQRPGDGDEFGHDNGSLVVTGK
ncbi:hypothetical protein D3C81_1947090 [compost metagenome]